MTPEEKAAKDRAAIIGSPVLLGCYVLGYDRFCETQARLDKWIRKRVDFSNPAQFKGLFLLPRETFKTTFLGPCLTTTILLNDPNRSVLLAGETHGNAVDVLSEVKGHYESNIKFRQHFGNWVKPSKWKEDKIIIKTRQKQRKDWSVWALGKTGAGTGKHPDDIIADDIAGDEDRDSAASRASTLIFFQRLWSFLNKQTGRFWMPGTRKHTKDIYWHIKENLNPELKRLGLDPFHIYELPAHKIIDGKRTQVLNFPTLLPEKKLQELKVVTSSSDGMDFATYESEYELNPLDPQTAIFKVFHYYKHTDCKYKAFVMATDPAISVKGTACYSAIAVLGQIDGGINNNKWGLAYCSVERREPSKLVADHNRIYRMFYRQYCVNNDEVGIDVYMESNGFQQLLIEQAQTESLDDGDIPVPTMGYKTVQNKDVKIRGLEPFISQGLLLFREDHKDAPEGYELALDQFRQYPQAEKDAPDVIAVAHKKTRTRHYAAPAEPEPATGDKIDPDTIKSPWDQFNKG